VAVWLQAAGGRPQDALAWGAAGLTAQAWAGLPAALARGDWSGLSDWPAAQQLAVLQKLCHDLMARGAGAATRYFAPEQLPAAPPMSVLAVWARELMAAARTVEHPFNAGLLQEAWAARTRQVLRPRPARG
jgi:DNA polymerase-3 subunit delta'